MWLPRFSTSTGTDFISFLFITIGSGGMKLGLWNLFTLTKIVTFLIISSAVPLYLPQVVIAPITQEIAPKPLPKTGWPLGGKRLCHRGVGQPIHPAGSGQFGEPPAGVGA